MRLLAAAMRTFHAGLFNVRHVESLRKLLVAVQTLENILRHGFSPALIIALMPAPWNSHEDEFTDT
jgi:hypothetical protein